jgi:hypothetical protein
MRFARVMLVVVIASAVVLSALYVGFVTKHKAQSVQPPAGSGLASSPSHPRRRAAESKPVEPVGLPLSERNSSGNSWPKYRESLAQSRDYWSFAHAILAAAKSGDADAQFYLFRAMDSCKGSINMYLQRRGRPLSLDEALQFAAKRGLPVERVQTVFDRCHEFQTHDSSELGNAEEWLAKATAAGEPLAQVTTALNLLLQSELADIAKANGSPDPDLEAKVKQGGDPRELLRAAVKSKDPEVLFSMGEAQGQLNPSKVDSNTDRLAWFLVGCERGFDCSANAEWVKDSCMFDVQCQSANSPSYMVSYLARDDWPVVQERARLINAKLDAGDWNTLGLGP